MSLLGLARSSGARVVHASRRYERSAVEQEKRVEKALAKEGIELRLHSGGLLHEPDGIRNQAGTPFLAFSAFWRAASALHVARPLPEPEGMPPSPGEPVDSASFAEQLSRLKLKPKVAWGAGLRETWTAGEAAAQSRLAAFAEAAMAAYKDARDLPGELGTSRLSPHLRFGEVSPRQAWAAALPGRGDGPSTFMKELGWREFSYYLLHHFPHLERAPLRSEFEGFPWEHNAEWLRLWQRGRTGYPIVDAGMRELWQTGWMHNRVRMIVASFLVKDLRIHWIEGARWFWDTLVDADLANNTQGWQWTAGCGADAAPYFRVFNPILQGIKFDPSGRYVRRWVPEVASRANADLHAPYGRPVVDHFEARGAALAAFDRIKKNK